MRENKVFECLRCDRLKLEILDVCPGEGFEGVIADDPLDRVEEVGALFRV